MHRTDRVLARSSVGSVLRSPEPGIPGSGSVLSTDRLGRAPSRDLPDSVGPEDVSDRVGLRSAGLSKAQTRPQTDRLPLLALMNDRPISVTSDFLGKKLENNSFIPYSCKELHST